MLSVAYFAGILCCHNSVSPSVCHTCFSKLSHQIISLHICVFVRILSNKFTELDITFPLE